MKVVAHIYGTPVDPVALLLGSGGCQCRSSGGDEEYDQHLDLAVRPHCESWTSGRGCSIAVFCLVARGMSILYAYVILPEDTI